MASAACCCDQRRANRRRDRFAARFRLVLSKAGREAMPTRSADGSTQKPHVWGNIQFMQIAAGATAERRHGRGRTTAKVRATFVVLTLFAGCSRKELSSFGRPLCKVFQHWCEETSEEKYPNGAAKSRGQVLQDQNDNYVKVGLWTFWHDNGQKSEEGEYKDGERSGDWMYWRENGKKLKEGKFTNGKETGVWTYWYENGRKDFEGENRHGKRFGVWTFWHENGRKREEGRYEADLRVGVWTSWYQSGQKLAETQYAGGRAVQDRMWNEKGEAFQMQIEPTFPVR